MYFVFVELCKKKKITLNSNKVVVGKSVVHSGKSSCIWIMFCVQSLDL